MRRGAGGTVGSAVVLITLAVVAGYVAGRLRAPGPRHLAPPKVRYRALLVAGVAADAVAPRVDGFVGLTLLLTGLGVLALTAAANVHVAGAGMLTAGVVMNLAVIGWNGGMPVRHDALVEAGIVHDAGEVTLDGQRHLETADDHLKLLDDRIPIRPAQLVVSLGDTVLAVGLAVVVARTTRRLRPPAVSPARPAREREPLPAGESTAEWFARQLVTAGDHDP